MSLIQSIVLGIVQGFGEFLPISSSGHLILVPWLLGWPEHSLSFDVMLHAGTLFAVVAYFWKDWLLLLREGFLSVRERSLAGPPERLLFWCILIASIPGALIGKFFEDKAESAFRAPLLTASALGIFAIIFYLFDRFGRKTRSLKTLGILDSVIIGISQAVAIIPGVSRSGITMAAGLGLKLDRESSVRFSFLISTPIIFGATLLKLKEIANLTDGAGILIAGFGISAITGFIAIHYLLAYVRKHTFNIFVIYRIILSLVIFSVFFLRK